MSPRTPRSYPFDEDDASRKRQRISCSASPDSPRTSTSQSEDAGAADSDSMKIDTGSSVPPRTPTRSGSDQLSPKTHSSRLTTINLRVAPVSSSPSPSPSTPSHMVHAGEDIETRQSVESESDALSTVGAMETPSSSPSALGSPDVELLPQDEDSDSGSVQFGLHIREQEDFHDDLMDEFPCRQQGEQTCVVTVKKIAYCLQCDSLPDFQWFVDLSRWISKFLKTTAKEDSDSTWSFGGYFKNNIDFWLLFPKTVAALSLRTKFFGPYAERSQETSRSLTRFLQQFARLTARFIALDAALLSDHPDFTQVDQKLLPSKVYLQSFAYLVCHDEQPHIGRNMEIHYHWNWQEEKEMLIFSFRREGGNIESLTKLVGGHLRLMSGTTKVTDSLVDLCKVAHTMVREACLMLRSSQVTEDQMLDAQEMISQAYEFWKEMARGLESILVKPVTFQTSDTAGNLLDNLTNIYYAVLDNENDKTGTLKTQKQSSCPQVPGSAISVLISQEWKFTVLTKLIMSTQMQLRVAGVTNMCGTLLTLHSSHKRHDAATSPLLLHFADLIIENSIIEHLVGPGAHPEIIHECGNILGFLMVTKTFGDPQKNKIWNAITTSQDPRIVDAILRMLRRILSLQDYASLLDLCEKAKDVPLESWTPSMLEFLGHLAKELTSKTKTENIPFLQSPPYDLCVRLIRESSIGTPEQPAGNLAVQHFVYNCFRDLLSHGPGPEKRDDIYFECVQDLKTGSPTSPGSICVITSQLERSIHSQADLKILTLEYGITSLVVEETERTFSDDRFPYDPALKSPTNRCRRSLIQMIVEKQPSTVTQELGTRLWDLLVGEKSSAGERVFWWDKLNHYMREPHSENVFVTACFNDYLPHLPPSCFTSGSLEFVKEAMNKWLTELCSKKDDDEPFQSAALDQLWRMILSAPPMNIDAGAIDILVEAYVRDRYILSRPRPKARMIHLALVTRCLGQLADAANQLKNFSRDYTSSDGVSMAIVVPEADFEKQETIFARSLAVLREFLQAYQSTKHFATPKVRPQSINSLPTPEGDPLIVKYQSFTGKTRSEIQSLSLGRLSTAASLFVSLQKATGFENYKVYCGGKELDPEEIDVCKSLEELKITGLILVQQRESVDITAKYPGSNTTVELEITKHFDKLYGYLGMHELVAHEIYLFLVKFPVYGQLLKDLDSETTQHFDIFPRGMPYKSLYAIHALREFLSEELSKDGSDEELLRKSLTLIVVAISDPSVLEQCSLETKQNITNSLLQCFLQLVKDRALPESVTRLFDGKLLERLLQLLHFAKSPEQYDSQFSIQVTWRAFDAILTISSHNQSIWNAFLNQLRAKGDMLLADLILTDPRMAVRKSVAKLISFNVGSASPPNIAVALWPLLAGLVEETDNYPSQSEELFWLCQQLFKNLTDTSIDFLNLRSLVENWGGLLLSRPNMSNFDDPDDPDLVVQGLANLCCAVALFAEKSRQSLQCGPIGEKLFGHHLFPPESKTIPNAVTTPRLPVLHHGTRRVLADTVFLLVKDDLEPCKKILNYMNNVLVPYSNDAEPSPYAYDLPQSWERNRYLRSPTGYVGLRNLSNTCYLNSLLTQLYMNVPFRKFMVQPRLSTDHQKLLKETQILFGNMQNDYTRYVHPDHFAGAIRTYEESSIDVSVQMDVDEFYNLLFDRWEGQIVASDARRTFKSFYGGQLVQQVKSKECSHISERLEPFSAIQCDIKGKSTLEQSLKAYVEGEVMEGDNKYKCTSCDREVEAVKRACLKDVPDNLIFHLKRFDYDLVKGIRSKVNDYFSFPPRIDMRPYKVEHFADSPDTSPEDTFELVGVLVHAGTAESGHYYSFAKERPSTNDKETWIEFNDDLVNTWDPAAMENACFGGVDYNTSNMQFDKCYSAYMLFYQRSSSLASQQMSLKTPSPVRVPLPRPLANELASFNEQNLRKYCLYDQSHSNFVAKMLTNVRRFNGGCCSDTHVLEKKALTVALNHLDQVVSRTKELPEFPAFLHEVRHIILSCGECSRDFLEWFHDRPESFRHLLLRCGEAIVRGEFAVLITAALAKVKSDASYAYGLVDDETLDGYEGANEPPPMLLQKVVAVFHRFWDVFFLATRAWPDYFGVLLQIAKLGRPEAALLLDADFLAKTCHVITAEEDQSSLDLYRKMAHTINRQKNRGRPVSFDAAISLLSVLMQTCDFTIPLKDKFMDKRYQLAIGGENVPASGDERGLVVRYWIHDTANVLVQKIIELHANYTATRSILVVLLQLPEQGPTEPEGFIDQQVYNAITRYITKGQHSLSCGSALRAALTYCEFSRSSDGLWRMMKHVVEAAHQPDILEGKDYLQFFKDLITMPKNYNGFSNDLILKALLDQVSRWAPSLLNHFSVTVCEDTENFLNEHVLRIGIDRTEVDLVMAQNLGLACLEYLDNTYVKGHTQALRSSLNNIFSVIENCAPFFEADNPGDPMATAFFSKKQMVLAALHRVTVDEIDEEASDWDGSDGEYSSVNEQMEDTIDVNSVNV